MLLLPPLPPPLLQVMLASTDADTSERKTSSALNALRKVLLQSTVTCVPPLLPLPLLPLPPLAVLMGAEMTATADTAVVISTGISTLLPLIEISVAVGNNAARASALEANASGTSTC